MRLDEMFSILNELDFHDRWPLLDELVKHKGKKRFIHFTKPISSPGGKQKSPDQYKFGINPVPNSHWRNSAVGADDILNDPKGRSTGMTVKTHNDPEGIYFYPVDWLFSEHERVRSGDQFALNWPRWYVIDVEWDSPGIVLSKVTWADVDALADRNGWRHLLDEWRAEPEKFKYMLPYWAKPDNAAAVMWSLLDYFQRSKTISWRKAFKGVSYIYDDNNSIIYSHEPQLLILDPKIVKMVDSGDQDTQALDNRDVNSSTYWSGAIKKLFERMRAKRGGDIVWRSKQATYHLETSGCTFDLKFTGNWKTGVDLNFRWGRAVGSWFGEFKQYENIDLLADAINSEMDKTIALAKRKQDIFFKPKVSIEEGIRFLNQYVVGDIPVKFNTEIYNEKRPYYRITGSSLYNDGVNEITTTFSSMGQKDSFSANVEISINGNSIGKASSSIEGSEQLSDIPEKLKAQLDRTHDMLLDGRSPSSSSLYKFWNEQEFNAFKGWIAAHANLNTENTLNNYLSMHEAYYEQYPHKSSLEDSIAVVYRK